MRRCNRFLPFGLVLLLVPAGCEKQTSGTPSDAAPPAADARPALPDVADGPQPPTGNQSTSAAPKGLSGPRWSCEQTQIDFGEAWAGFTVRHTFTIRNAGTELLRILEAKAQCSCTASDDYTREIPPGGEGTMTIRLLTAGKRGFVKEAMKIKTNDPVNPEITFELKGMVKVLLEAEVLTDLAASKSSTPDKALAELNKQGAGNFGKITADQRLQRTVKLRNATSKPIKLKLVGMYPKDSRFDAQFQETAPGEEFLLTITGDPPFPEGPSSASVVLETDVPGYPTYNLGVSAYVPPRIELVPRRIVVDPAYPYVAVRKIRLNNNGDVPWRLKGIAVSDPIIQVQVVSMEGGKHYNLEVTLPAAGYVCPPYGELIRLELTDKESTFIDLPIVGSLDREVAPRPDDKPLTLHAVPVGK